MPAALPKNVVYWGSVRKDDQVELVGKHYVVNGEKTAYWEAGEGIDALTWLSYLVRRTKKKKVEEENKMNPEDIAKRITEDPDKFVGEQEYTGSERDKMKTSHELARELLAGPDLPILLQVTASGGTARAYPGEAQVDSSTGETVRLTAWRAGGDDEEHGEEEYD